MVYNYNRGLKHASQEGVRPVMLFVNFQIVNI